MYIIVFMGPHVCRFLSVSGGSLRSMFCVFWDHSLFTKPGLLMCTELAVCSGNLNSRLRVFTKHLPNPWTVLSLSIFVIEQAFLSLNIINESFVNMYFMKIQWCSVFLYCMCSYATRLRLQLNYYIFQKSFLNMQTLLLSWKCGSAKYGDLILEFKDGGGHGPDQLSTEFQVQ